MSKTGPWEFAKDLAISLLGQDFMVAISLLGAFAIYFIWKTKWNIPRKSILTVVVAAITLVLAYTAWIYQNSKQPPPAASEDLTKVPVSIDCTASSSTTVMPADGVLYEVSLAKYTGNADYLAQRFGPSGTEVQLSNKLQVIRRCHVINHGPIPIFNAELTLHLMFRGVIRDSENPSTTRSGDIMFETDWTIHPPTINVGQPGFVFYIVNSSQEFVFVTIGEFMTFKRPNSNDRHTTQLMQFPG